MQNHAENGRINKAVEVLVRKLFSSVEQIFFFQIIRLNGILKEKLNQPGCTVILIFEDFFLGKNLRKIFTFSSALVISSFSKTFICTNITKCNLDY